MGGQVCVLGWGGLGLLLGLMKKHSLKLWIVSAVVEAAQGKQQGRWLSSISGGREAVVDMIREEDSE